MSHTMTNTNVAKNRFIYYTHKYNLAAVISISILRNCAILIQAHILHGVSPFFLAFAFVVLYIAEAFLRP